MAKTMRRFSLFLRLIGALGLLVSCLTEATTPSSPHVAISTSREGIKIGAVTWNLGERSPSVEECLFLRELHDCDLLVLGVQEVEDLRPRRDEGRRSRRWKELLDVFFHGERETACASSAALCDSESETEEKEDEREVRVTVRKSKRGRRDDAKTATHTHPHASLPLSLDALSQQQPCATPQQSYECLLHRRLGGMQLSLFANARAAALVREVRCVCVPCGVGNLLSNKGGVAALLRLHSGHTLALINAHLAAHTERVRERNEDYQRIARSLFTHTPRSWLRRSKTSAPRNNTTLESPPRGKSKDNRRVNRKSKSADKKGTTKNNKNKINIKKQSKKKQSRFSKKKSLLNSGDRLGDAMWQSAQSAMERLTQASVASLSKKRHARKRRIPLLKDMFDAVIMLGDLNYRISLPRAEIESFCVRHNMGSEGINTGRMCFHPADPEQFEEDLEDILDHDQLAMQQNRRCVLQGFSEGKIRFPPTYKFDKKANRFDSSRKARCPAWTDRILFASSASSKNNAYAPTKKKIALSLSQGSSGDDYYAVDSRTSDHRPVCAKLHLTMSESDQ